jgi:catechol 2,3-dioxygenase-like lactoylglutathione lyase family enzyme
MAFHIDHVVLCVLDPRASLAFYTDVVGLPAVRGDEFLAGKVPFPSVRVSEHSMLDLLAKVALPFARGLTGADATGAPINHVCLAMDAAEFDAMAARLDGAGVKRHRVGERSYGARGSSPHWFYFQDPDGNVIEARYYDEA